MIALASQPPTLPKPHKPLLNPKPSKELVPLRTHDIKNTPKLK